MRRRAGWLLGAALLTALILVPVTLVVRDHRAAVEAEGWASVRSAVESLEVGEALLGAEAHRCRTGMRDGHGTLRVALRAVETELRCHVALIDRRLGAERRRGTRALTLEDVGPVPAGHGR